MLFERGHPGEVHEFVDEAMSKGCKGGMWLGYSHSS